MARLAWRAGLSVFALCVGLAGCAGTSAPAGGGADGARLEAVVDAVREALNEAQTNNVSGFPALKSVTIKLQTVASRSVGGQVQFLVFFAWDAVHGGRGLDGGARDGAAEDEREGVDRGRAGVEGCPGAGDQPREGRRAEGVEGIAAARDEEHFDRCEVRRRDAGVRRSGRDARTARY